MSLVRRLWSLLPIILLGLSLTLHLGTIVLYTRLPLKFAAFTVFPIWVWGLIGLSMAAFTYLCFRKPGALLLSMIWIFTILAMADEARSLGRIGMDPIPRAPAAPHAGTQVLRVATLNCKGSVDPSAVLGPFSPDIIFLQEMPHLYRLKQVIDLVYQGRGDYQFDAGKGCAIIVRGTVHHTSPIPNSRSQLVAVEMPDGRHLELLNIHLNSAATNMRLYRRDCWWEHRQNRALRQVELSYSLATLEQRTAYPRVPAIIAGDFNAPANDTVYRMLKKDFTDAFGTVGTGWGNTFPSNFPVLRIDQIYCSDKLTPVRSHTFTVDKTDHRLVIADFVYR